MAKHYYNGKAKGTLLWIPPAEMGKKQIQRERAFLPRKRTMHSPDEVCNYKPEGKELWIRRVKRSGEPYMLKVVVGEKCGAQASIVKKDPETGAAIRRCLKHAKHNEPCPRKASTEQPEETEEEMA